jgi:predicted transcriptional regulator
MVAGVIIGLLLVAAIIWGVSHDTHKATIIAANVGRLFAYLFIFIGLAMVLGGNIYDGLWMAFIGWFLESAAVAQVQQQKLKDILSNYTVRQAMATELAVIPDHITLDVLAEHHFLDRGNRAYLVQQNGRPAGLLTIHQLQQAPRSQWPHTTAAQVMIPLSRARAVHPDDDLWTALSNMDREGVNQVLVVEDGAIVGAISREDLVSFLQRINMAGA